MKSVSAVLLAAGMSKRMGEQNKLEMDISGVPLLRRTVEVLLASKLQEIVVVIGHETNKTLPLLKDLPVNVVFNEFYNEGQMTSVHKGMKSLSKQCDGIMVCLSDQPLLQSDDIDVLINAFSDEGQKSILVPTYKGARGNPIILANENKDTILDSDRKLGCKRLIENSPELVTTIEMNTNHVVVDLDTPQDYANFQENR